MPTPPANATTSSFQIGTYAPLTDSFTQTLDLNDGATFRIHPKGLKLDQPEKVVVESGNVRTAGAVVPRWQYKNRHIQVEISLRGNTVAAILSSIRSLLAAIENPPYTIRLALPNATLYSYADVVSVKHDIPSDTQQILAKAITRIHIDFECRPGLRGDRVTLQNLVPNAGFEQPSKANVTVFNDAYATNASLNLYTVVAGATPAFAAGFITLATGATVTFGSPGWGSFAEWRVRFTWATGLTATFYLHYTDANNYLAAQVTSTTLTLIQRIAGVNNTLNSQSFAALTNAVGYFLQITQFPSAPGEVTQVQAILSLSSSGLPGPITATAGPINSTDATTALSGKMGFTASGASLQVGGVNWVTLFGPGGWQFATTATTVTGSGAWDGMGNAGPTAFGGTTYTFGPVKSWGALRVDAPPAGTWDSTWNLYSGGAPTWAAGGTWAIALPSASPQTMAGSVQVNSSGLSVNATLQMTVREYDVSGTFLRSGVIASTNRSEGVWTQLSGTYVTGNFCVYVDIGLRAADTSAPGASANAVVKWDNAQLWNQTQLSGQSSMPWCDLRAVVSPASLVVSGLVGDMPAPAQLSLGTFVTSWPQSGTMVLYAGRKLKTSPYALFQNASIGYYGQGSSASLDATTFGGYNASSTVGTGGWNPRFTSPTASDAAGTYHLLARVYTQQTAPNLVNMTVRVATAQQTSLWFSQPSGSDVVGQWTGPYSNPFTARTTWLLADAGQCVLPPFPQGALTDPTALGLTPRTQWADGSASGATGFTNWQVLLPIDGTLLMATANNPSNSAGAVTNKWLWLYSDGLLLNRAGSGDTAAWTTSVEPNPLPNPGFGAGGVGTGSSGSININSTADPFLVLDPNQIGILSASGGVNQLVTLLTDQAVNVQAAFGEVSYSPLYLYPR